MLVCALRVRGSTHTTVPYIAAFIIIACNMHRDKKRYFHENSTKKSKCLNVPATITLHLLPLVSRGIPSQITSFQPVLFLILRSRRLK